MRIKIGSRASDLARIQAYTVGKLLEQKGHQVEYNFRESLGDLNPQIDLSKTFEKGVFTQDFHQGLVDGTYDLVVHSWKDLPTEERPGTKVVATLPREDMRDVLLLKDGDLSKLKNIQIFSSSPRRAYNLKTFLAWALPQPIGEIEFVNVRGNVPTRLRKLKETEEVQGLIVAKAALDRMLGCNIEEFKSMKSQMRDSVNGVRWMVLPLQINPCAAAQGALALEIAEGKPEVQKAIEALNCEITWNSVREEREILKGFGGGCHQKIGVSVLERPFGKILFLQGLTDSGEVLNKFELSRKSQKHLKASASQVYPSPGEKLESFASQELKINANEFKGKDLWIAKAKALPEDFMPAKESVIWTAGLESWRKLSARGVWVNGCAESLGEQENESVEHLLGRSANWLKLTHDRGVASEGKDFYATYRLKGDFKIPKLEARKYFYWQSGSQFLQVWENNQALLNDAHHACGPGHTYSVIKSLLKDKSRLEVYLSVKDWWRSLGVK